MIKDRHSQLLDRLLVAAKGEPYTVGIMLQGSVARGDHYPDSDLDLLVLVEEGRDQGLVTVEVEGILVERHYRDRVSLREKLERRPMLAYGLLNGRILFDPHGQLAELVADAKRHLDEYVTPEALRRGTRYWLYSSRKKLSAAVSAGDELKAAFLTATNSWKILEGIWVVNDLPIPHGGAVLAHIQDLPEKPDNLGARLDRLFLGTVEQRAASSLDLIDWVLARMPNKSA